eukprot:1859115-Prymnesium_polylepis.4
MEQPRLGRHRLSVGRAHGFQEWAGVVEGPEMEQPRLGRRRTNVGPRAQEWEEATPAAQRPLRRQVGGAESRIPQSATDLERAAQACGGACHCPHWCT